MASQKTFPLQRPAPNAWSPDNANRGGQVPQTPQLAPPSVAPSLARRALAARATIGGPQHFSCQSQQTHSTYVSSAPLVRRAPAHVSLSGRSFVPGASSSSSATVPVHRPSATLVQSPRASNSNPEIHSTQHRTTSPQFPVGFPATQRSQSNIEINRMQLGLASPRNSVGLPTTPRSQIGACSPRVAASSPALSPRQHNTGSQSGQLAMKARLMTPPNSALSPSRGTLPLQRLQPFMQQGRTQSPVPPSKDVVIKQTTSSVDNKEVAENQHCVSVSLRPQEDYLADEKRSMSQELAATLVDETANNSHAIPGIASHGQCSIVMSDNVVALGTQDDEIEEAHRRDTHQSTSRDTQSGLHSPRGQVISSSSCDRDALGISPSGPFIDWDFRLLHLCTSSSYQHIAQKGDVLFTEGDSDDRMLIMVQGEVEMMTSVLPGHKPFTRVLRAPCFFGEACALGLQQLRSSTVRAQTFCEVRVLPGETFRELLHRFPHEEKLILNEAKSRLAGLAIWEGVSRKRDEEYPFRPTSGSTTSWSQESSVAVSRRGSFSNRSGFHKTSSLGSHTSSMPSGNSGSQPSSVPPSRLGSKSPPPPAQDGTGQSINGKQSSSGSTNPSSSTDPKSTGSGSSNGRETQPSLASKHAAESSSSCEGQARPGGEVISSDLVIKPWMTALVEITSLRNASAEMASPRDMLCPRSNKIASEVPCEFAWSDGSVQDEMLQIAEPLASRSRGRSREDRETFQTRPSVTSSVSSQSSLLFEPASSMSRLPGTSSLRVLPALETHTEGMALDAHLEDDFESETGPWRSSSSGPSPTLSSLSSPRELTPVDGQSSKKWNQRVQHRRRHKPPKPREGWQKSICQQVVINYPAALPSKDTFVKRKVPRPVSRDASCGSLIEGLEAAVEKEIAESNTTLLAGLPEAAASRLRESSPEIDFGDDEPMSLVS